MGFSACMELYLLVPGLFSRGYKHPVYPGQDISIDKNGRWPTCSDGHMATYIPECVNICVCFHTDALKIKRPTLQVR